MNPELFLEDLRRKPDVLRMLATSLQEGNPWAFLTKTVDRVVFLGMGSSSYAAGVAAARLRAHGIQAVAELASSTLLPDWGDRALVVAISATGTSIETLDALERLPSAGLTVALTNSPASPLSELCDRTVLLEAGPELGGVACRSFQHTLALLMCLEAQLLGSAPQPVPDTVRRAADASAGLLETSPTWLPEVTAVLDGPDGTHLAAPAHRLASALQGALMLREGPRRFAVGCEAGDWAHVDVYLTKNTDYRLLVFAGSPWDAGIREWTGPRETPVVSVGGEFPDARYTVRFDHDGLDDVRLLTETLVPELLAASLWARGTGTDG